MLIDCGRCELRELACGDCLITALHERDAPAGRQALGARELQALGTLAAAGPGPALHLPPLGRRRGVHLPTAAPAVPAGGTRDKECVWHVRTPLPGIGTRLRGSVAIAAAVAAATGIAVYTGTAGAAPQPSVSQVQQ